MQSTPPARILAILGNDADQQVFQGLISADSFPHEQAAGVEEALACLDAADFDLLILGPSLSQDIPTVTACAQAQKAELPIIAGFSPAPSATGYAAGVSVYLSWPPETAELGQTLRGIPLLSSPVFNWDVALENMGVMEIVQEIIKVFLTEAPALFEDVRRAIGEGETPAIARTAHRFAGGIAVFGDIPCVKAARGLELAAEGGGSVTDNWFWLEHTYARLYATLQTA